LDADHETPGWFRYVDRLVPIVVVLCVGFGAIDLAQGRIGRGLYVMAIGLIAYLANRQGKKRRSTQE
jgi:hypothetical protein